MSKILHIITGLNTGGAEAMLYKLLSDQNQVKNYSIVISLTDKGTFGSRIEQLNIPVYTLHLKLSILLPFKIYQFIKLVKEIKPSLMQGWLTHGNLATVLLHIFLKKTPILWNIRHSVLSEQDSKKMTLIGINLLANLSHLPEKIIYNSHASAFAHETIGFKKSKTLVISNGFETSLFSLHLVGVERTICKTLDIDNNVILIGMIARFHPMKDHKNFLQACALLLEKYSDVHFILFGKNVSRENKVLSNLLIEQNLENSLNIHLMEENQEIHKILPQLDIVTSSSFSEGFPNVIGEAMSCAVPCVVTDVGDSAFIVGSTGKVVPPKNPQVLCNAWTEMIEMGKEARYELGKLARQRIQKHFSIDAIANQYQELYQSLI